MTDEGDGTGSGDRDSGLNRAERFAVVAWCAIKGNDGETANENCGEMFDLRSEVTFTNERRQPRGTHDLPLHLYERTVVAFSS